MLMEESEEMREAGKKLLELSEDEEAREIARIREDSKWALRHMLHATEERSREEERKKAGAKQRENVKNGFKNNIPIETISILTGLSIQEIEALK